MKIGFIGLGAMGAPMAENLIRKGFDVAVHNRTRSKEEPLAVLGARRANTPGEAALGAEAVITIVPDTPDVKEVLFGSQGIAASAQEGTVVADMSTIDPGATALFGRRLAEQGVSFVDAPVSGGTEGAKAGTLSIMAGGEAEDFEKLVPIFEALGTTINLIGPLGSGQMTKAINQVIIAGTFLAVAEGIALGVKTGLDMKAALRALSAGAARSWVLEARSERMLDRKYPLGFKVGLHRKDLRIGLSVARESGLNLPLATMVAEREDELIARGFGDDDMSAVYESIVSR